MVYTTPMKSMFIILRSGSTGSSVSSVTLKYLVSKCSLLRYSVGSTWVDVIPREKIGSTPVMPAFAIMISIFLLGDVSMAALKTES